MAGVPERCPVRRRVLRRVPAVRAARARPRPDGRGGLQRDPGRRVGVVDLGAARRRVRPRLAGSRCWTPRTQRGIEAIIGTPTYAVPPWLRRTLPGDRGRTRHRRAAQPYGARQDINHSHPTFRRLAERLIRKIVARYADHPAVHRLAGGQRAGHQRLPQPGRVRRLPRVAARALRRRRGAQPPLGSDLLVAPAARTGPTCGRRTATRTPSYDLAWRRYQAELTHEYIAWQTELVRGLVPEHHFVTTCLALHQPAQDVAAIGAPLDVVAHEHLLRDRRTGSRCRATTPSRPSRTRSFLPWSGTAWLYLQARPLARHAAGAVPGDRDERHLDRRLGGQLPALPRPAAPGGVGDGRARRADGRVLALAHAALRRGDLLGRDPRPQPAAGPDLRRARGGRPGS